jgi:hypothetical protein
MRELHLVALLEPAAFLRSLFLPSLLSLVDRLRSRRSLAAGKLNELDIAL